MTRKTYVITRYARHSVFDKNLKLVWRWFSMEKICFSNLRKATKYFRAFNMTTGHKAVLRTKEVKKHVKR